MSIASLTTNLQSAYCLHLLRLGGELRIETMHLCSIKRTMRLGQVHWWCTLPSGNGMSASYLLCGCLAWWPSITLESTLKRERRLWQMWNCRAKNILPATTIPHLDACVLQTRPTEVTFSLRLLHKEIALTACQQCTLRLPYRYCMVYGQWGLWKTGNMEGASNLHQQWSQSSREHGGEWRPLYFSETTSLGVGISDINKVESIYFSAVSEGSTHSLWLHWFWAGEDGGRSLWQRLRMPQGEQEAETET